MTTFLHFGEISVICALWHQIKFLWFSRTESNVLNTHKAADVRRLKRPVVKRKKEKDLAELRHDTDQQVFFITNMVKYWQAIISKTFPDVSCDVLRVLDTVAKMQYFHLML